jgi:hypothetical protein
VARITSAHSRSSGKRNRARERWAQRGFSPADLLNLWEPSGAWEQYCGLAYGGNPRHKLDVYKPRRAYRKRGSNQTPGFHKPAATPQMGRG